ncbi:MAG: ribonuclease Z [Halobacteriota archaeon]|jgi:ribonuclease BN (tRNA processing enzyme)
MEVVFLGTNGWYDTKTGNTTCVLVESKDHLIILDAGNGIYKVDQYDRGQKPVSLFLSHFHLDHIAGLHILNRFNFKRGLQIFGQVGTTAILNNIVNEPFTVPLSQLPFKVEVKELPEGTHNIPFLVECKYLFHSSTCLGYRFQLDGKIITYCPDTGICENAIRLARNADLLIAECSFKRGQRNYEWPHLNPDDAVAIADEARVKKLVLVHFDADVYKTLKERIEVQEEMRMVFENLVVSFDNLQLKV